MGDASCTVWYAVVTDQSNELQNELKPYHMKMISRVEVDRNFQ